MAAALCALARISSSASQAWILQERKSENSYLEIVYKDLELNHRRFRASRSLSELAAWSGLLIPVARILRRNCLTGRHRQNAAVRPASLKVAMTAEPARHDCFQIRSPTDQEHENLKLVDRLVDVVNEAYTFGEAGMWSPEFRRTTADEMKDLLRSKSILLLEDLSRSAENRILGQVVVKSVGTVEFEVGMLAVTADVRGRGLGSMLMAAAERHACELGANALRLELLTPRHWDHPQKVKLDRWYRNLGFEPTASGDFGKEFPQLCKLLATEAKFTVYTKRL